jgi:hypothetical protein
MASSPGGISMPRALAVSRLITSSNPVGCVTGRSAGVLPSRIRGTYCQTCPASGWPELCQQSEDRAAASIVNPPTPTHWSRTLPVGPVFRLRGRAATLARARRAGRAEKLSPTARKYFFDTSTRSRLGQSHCERLMGLMSAALGKAPNPC